MAPTRPRARLEVLGPAERPVAACLASEAKLTPSEWDRSPEAKAARSAFRSRWSPWLWGRAPGPINPDTGSVEAWVEELLLDQVSEFRAVS